MAYPILAPQSTWFAPTNTSVKRANITEIEIMDSYTPDASVTVTDSWDASAAKDGSITCYVIDTKLIMAGNGSGRIKMNEDSERLFSYDNTYQDNFNNLELILHADLFDTSDAKKFFFIFWKCANLRSVDVSTWDTSNVTNMASMFVQCDKLDNIDISRWDVSSVTNASMMFSKCKALSYIDMSKFIDATALKNIQSMFADCISLKRVDGFSTLNTSNISKLTQLFQNCTSLKEIDTSGLNTSNITDMSFMFYSCSSLGEINVSNWDVSKVTNFDHFAAHANLKRKGIENWKTTSATNMNALFHNCAEEELDLSGWDVSKVQFFCQMFENSPNLKRIKGLDRWNTSAGLGFDGMFEHCVKLEEVDLSSFNTAKAKNGTKASENGHNTATLQNMFLSCNNLKKVKLGPNFSINGDGTNTAAANKLILPTPSADYIEGADGNWYTFIGDSYAPNAMKDKTDETYYASPIMVLDADVVVKNSSLIDIAKAIREKNGTTTKYTPAQFGEAIRAL